MARSRASPPPTENHLTSPLAQNQKPTRGMAQEKTSLVETRLFGYFLPRADQLLRRMYSGNVRGTPSLRSGGYQDFSELSAVCMGPSPPTNTTTFSFLQASWCAVLGLDDKTSCGKGAGRRLRIYVCTRTAEFNPTKKEYPVIEDDGHCR